EVLAVGESEGVDELLAAGRLDEAGEEVVAGDVDRGGRQRALLRVGVAVAWQRDRPSEGLPAREPAIIAAGGRAGDAPGLGLLAVEIATQVERIGRLVVEDAADDRPAGGPGGRFGVLPVVIGRAVGLPAAEGIAADRLAGGVAVPDGAVGVD